MYTVVSPCIVFSMKINCVINASKYSLTVVVLVCHTYISRIPNNIFEETIERSQIAKNWHDDFDMNRLICKNPMMLN